MTTPHHSEPAREAVALVDNPLANKIATIIEEALTRHGVDAADIEGTLNDAGDVLALMPASPAPAASGGLEAGGIYLIRRIVIPMVRERSREPGDAWQQAEQVLAALSAPPATGGESLTDAEKRIMQEYAWGNLTKLGVVNHLRRAGFRIEVAIDKANALAHPSAETGAGVGVKEAITLALEWDERRTYIMPYKVRDKLRAVLSALASEGRSDG